MDEVIVINIQTWHVIAYFVIGFLAAVLISRYGDARWSESGALIVLMMLVWPILALASAFYYLIARPLAWLADEIASWLP